MSAQPTPNSLPNDESLLPKAIPKVEYDPRLVDVATVEIDAQFFGQLMASHGLSDTDIASTTIFASADRVIERQRAQRKPEDIVNFGDFDPKTKTITVSIAGTEELMRYIIETQDPNDPLDEEDITDMASAQATETTGHEVGHRIALALDQDSPADKRAYYTDKLPERRFGKIVRGLLRKSRNPAHHELADTLRQLEVGRMMLKGKEIQHEDYQHSPGEQFADSVRDEAMGRLGDEDPCPVRVSFKKLAELLAK